MWIPLLIVHQPIHVLHLSSDQASIDKAELRLIALALSSVVNSILDMRQGIACERMQYGGIRNVGIRSIEDFGVCE